MNPARTGERDAPEKTAGAVRERIGEILIVHCPKCGHQAVCLAPHDRGPVPQPVHRLGQVVHRQQRERPAGQEAFVGDIPVVVFMGDGADEARLPVAPLGDLDPGVPAQS